MDWLNSHLDGRSCGQRITLPTNGQAKKSAKVITAKIGTTFHAQSMNFINGILIRYVRPSHLTEMR